LITFSHVDAVQAAGPAHLAPAAAWSNGLKPLASLTYGGTSYTFYVGLGALILNIAVALVVTFVAAWIAPAADRSIAVRS